MLGYDESGERFDLVLRRNGMGGKKTTLTDAAHDRHVIRQGRAFIEAARELDCDEDEARFAETLRKVARHKPLDKPSEAKESKPKKPGR